MPDSIAKDEKTQLKKTILALRKTKEALKEAEIKLKDVTSNIEDLVRERTEKILESEQNYRELYESFGEAFIATDWEFNVIHWNKAAERITKIEAVNALGKKVYDILPEMLTVDITPYLEALQKRQPARFMMNTISRQTGRQSIFEISTYPSKKGIIYIVEDKTDEENTKRLSSIGQTAGMVGHDIRNPLQSIVGDVYLLRSDLTKMPECTTKEGVTESLDNIEKNVSYIDKIVQDLQDYARHISPILKEVGIEDIFKDVLVKKAIPDNIQASYQIEPEAVKIIVDPLLLKRILVNLVNNAIQAMESGGRLDLNACTEKGFYIIAVTDSGLGIPEEIKPRIFAPLFTTKSKGQGFGLAVVKRLTEALGGTINVESQEGKGTKFLMRLPIEKPSEPSQTLSQKDF